ncbi:MAG: helix-turn-helix transcriptional regulator [Pyrinomonadaceae bacterium]|nr:helix-turn-helix transcriptional regulator [Pyrinomonadaceae bacterium]
MTNTEAALHIMAVDCCEHTLTALRGGVPEAHLIPVHSADRERLSGTDAINLIVIGIAQYPVRRLYLSELRRIYPQTPVLILRRETIYPGDVGEYIRGEFILSDQSNNNDQEIVHALRQILPIAACPHLHKERNYDTLREVLRVLAEKYTDPGLDLDQVARELPISPKRLSRILNQEVGVSFRQLLRDMRIEEAKRILTSRQFSVKEVAARVGFSDSHYFSRSFRESTGLKAVDYQARTALFG